MLLLLFDMPMDCPSFSKTALKGVQPELNTRTAMFTAISTAVGCGRGEISLGAKAPNQVVLKDSF